MPKNKKDDTELYQEAKKRVEDIKGFYGHLFVYIGVNLTLLVINLVSSPGSLWFFWATLFWGIGLFWHGFGVFGIDNLFGKNWERRKIDEYIEKNKQ